MVDKSKEDEVLDRLAVDVNAAAKLMSDVVDGQSVVVVLMASMLLIESAMHYFEECAMRQPNDPVYAIPHQLVTMRLAVQEVLRTASAGLAVQYVSRYGTVN